MLIDSRKITDGLIIFSTLVSDFEKLDFKNDALAGVRANYFNSNMSPQKDKTEIAFDDKIYNLSYNMRNDEAISWKITRNNMPYQTVKKATGGIYCVIFYGKNGIINKRQYFDCKHNWLRTEYFDNYFENVLVAILSPKLIHGILTLELKNISSDGNHTSKILYPSLETPNGNCSSLMYSNIGMIWYDESFKPEDLPEIEFDEKIINHNGFDFNESKFSDINIINDSIDLLSADYLEDFDEIGALSKIHTNEICDSTDNTEVNKSTAQNYSAYDKIAKILSEAHKSNKNLFGEILSQTEDNISENSESPEINDNIASNDVEESVSDDIENEINKIIEECQSEQINIVDEHKNETILDKNIDLIEEINSNNSVKMPVSIDNQNNDIEIIDDIISKDTDVTDFENTVDNEEFQIDHCKEPACNVVIHTKSGRYSYFGDVDENNCRTGRGRTVSPEGYTSYDGQYQNDKRNGFGVCYYKEGDINYVGNWKDGNRQGCGIGYRLSDGTMHAGKWNNNNPDGFGARFDSNGNFLDVCDYSDGKRNGIGVSFDEHGNVIIKKWSNGEIISEYVVKNEA